jgi:hypothetical protein
MNQFTFESKQKTVLLGFMALGVLCLGLTFFMDDQPYHVRFWTNYLHNTVYFLGIAFLSLFVMMASITAYAGWHAVMRRLWEAYSLFLIPGLVLMLVVVAGIWGHWHHLYHWSDLEEVANDPIMSGKSAFLNKGWYTFGTLAIVGLWIFFALRLRALSLAEDQSQGVDYAHHRRMRIFAAIFLPIAGFGSAAVVWQWVMSIDAHWYSTLFAWYTTASWFVGAISLSILTLIYLKSKGYFTQVTPNHLHDLGKFMFAFSVFWTYLWFSQYMLIWYANIGEETIYFHTRLNEFPVLFYGNLALNFVAPFLILMRNDNKRKYGTLIITSIIVFFGHWWDFFQMIKPGALETALHAVGEHHHGFAAGFTIPGLLELGTFIGFTAGFLYFAFSRLEQASLQPENDPYYAESLNHQV